DLAPARSVQSSQATFARSYPNSAALVACECQYRLNWKPVRCAIVGDGPVLNEADAAVPIAHPKTSVWDGEERGYTPLRKVLARLRFVRFKSNSVESEQ